MLWSLCFYSRYPRGQWVIFCLFFSICIRYWSLYIHVHCGCINSHAAILTLITVLHIWILLKCPPQIHTLLRVTLSIAEMCQSQAAVSCDAHTLRGWWLAEPRWECVWKPAQSPPGAGELRHVQPGVRQHISYREHSLFSSVVPLTFSRSGES